MARFLVNYTAVYDVTVEVEASDAAAAERMAKDGQGDIIEANWDRVHPDTEFFVTEKED